MSEESPQDGAIQLQTLPPATKNEKDGLLARKHRVSLETAERLRIAAIVVSWVSCIGSIAQGTVALIYAWKDESQALFGFGLDQVLDGLSSAIVLWRFHGKELYDPIKELRACAIIGVLFLISAWCLIGKSIYALVKRYYEKRSNLLWNLCLVNGILCAVLAGVKFLVGFYLESRALQTDSVITFTGSVISFVALISLNAFMVNPHLWYLDNLFGILVGLFLTAFGMKLLVDITQHKEPCQNATKKERDN
ncbi:hypothetical protein ScPMuIL_009437 [Solemya velum]